MYINVMYHKMHDIQLFLYPSVTKHGTCHLSAMVIVNESIVSLPLAFKENASVRIPCSGNGVM